MKKTGATRIVKTGITKEKFGDIFLKKGLMFVDGALGQLSDGCGEGKKKYEPFWKNMKAEIKDDEVVVEVKDFCPLFKKADFEILRNFSEWILTTGSMAYRYTRKELRAKELKDDFEFNGWFFSKDFKTWTYPDLWQTCKILMGRA